MSRRARTRASSPNVPEMPLTSERQCWAEALKVEAIHADSAPAFIAERIGALALAGDETGVERWRQIAARLDQLREPRQFLLI